MFSPSGSDQKSISIIHRPEIDGLRALAVLPVILFHAGYSTFGGGFLGVDVFFVISGFLITGIVWAELERRILSIRKFYIRRARQILPALVLVLLSSHILAFALFLPGKIEAFCNSVFAALTFTSNIYFWKSINYFSPDSNEIPLLHFSSLGVEEQFYIVFPILLLLVARWRRDWALPILSALLILSLTLFYIWRRTDPRAVFYLFPFRAWEFLAGSCLAIMMPRLNAIGQGFGAILAMMGLNSDLGITYPAQYVGRNAAYLGARCRGWCDSRSRFREFRELVRQDTLAGAGSFRWINILQCLSLASTRHRVREVANFTEFSHERSFSVILTLALAALSWRFVERPFRYGTLASYPFTGGGIGIGLTAAAAGLLLFAQHSAPNRMPAYERGTRYAGTEITEYSSLNTIYTEPCTDDLMGSKLAESCRFGVSGEIPDVILWGDSYAGALLHGLDIEARKRGLFGAAYIKDGCPPLIGVSRHDANLCDPDFHLMILNHIVQQPGQSIVLLFGNIAAAYGDHPNLSINGVVASPSLARQGISKVRAALHASGKRLVLVEQGPTFKEDVAQYYLRLYSRLGERKATAGNEAHELTVPRSQQTKRVEGVRGLQNSVDLYVPTIDFFCNGIACNSTDDHGHLVMQDRDHVTRLYSEKLAAFILNATKNADFGPLAVDGGR